KGKISEATKEAYGSYRDLREDATAELNLMANSQGEITDELSASLTQKYKEMGDKILTAMKENHAKQLEEARKLFADSNVLTEEEEAKRLNKLKENQEKEIKEHEKKQARILELIKKAGEDKKGLTEKEWAELNKLNKYNDDQALKNL